MSDPFAKITMSTAAVPKKRDEGWRCLMPVPDDAPPPPETHPSLGKPSGRWLSVRSYEETGIAPGGQALDDTIRVLEARAYSEGPERVPHMRAGEMDGRAYLDLADAAWCSVEIDGDGWRMVDRAPVAFVRSGQMRPLAVPEEGYGIEELRRFVNVERDEDFFLLVAWIIAALRSCGPYPVLVFSGEQGTGGLAASFPAQNSSDHSFSNTVSQSPLRAGCLHPPHGYRPEIWTATDGTRTAAARTPHLATH